MKNMDLKDQGIFLSFAFMVDGLCEPGITGYIRDCEKVWNFLFSLVLLSCKAAGAMNLFPNRSDHLTG